MDIDREIARRLHEAPGIILHRSDIARDLIVRSLRDRERSEVVPGHTGLPHPHAALERPQAPESGPVEAPVTLGEDQIPRGQDRGADRLPMDADQFDTKAASSQDTKRTTGRKRPAAAKG